MSHIDNKLEAIDVASESEELTPEMIEAGKDERMECLKDSNIDVGTALSRIYLAMSKKQSSAMMDDRKSNVICQRLAEALEAINRVESDLGWTDDTKTAIAKIETSICDVQDIAIDEKAAWHRLVISIGCLFDFDTSGSLEEVAASARQACDKRIAAACNCCAC